MKIILAKYLTQGLAGRKTQQIKGRIHVAPLGFQRFPLFPLLLFIHILNWPITISLISFLCDCNVQSILHFWTHLILKNMKHSKGYTISTKKFWLILISQFAKANCPLGSEKAFPKGLRQLAPGLCIFGIFPAWRNESTIQEEKSTVGGSPPHRRAKRKSIQDGLPVFQDLWSLAPL